MAIPQPNYSKNAVNKAGDVLINPKSSKQELKDAIIVADNWRASHAYPINTFQATLRRRLKIFKGSFGAERLKRMSTIIEKLKRFKGMELSRMQDIGGLRAIVNTTKEVRELEGMYANDKNLKHKFVSEDDYILSPKNDGYRGVHIIFKYINPRNSSYDGLLLELQFRTKLQHLWATAVETMGTYLGQALKSGEGEKKWKDFFAITSSAFAYIENCSPLKQYSKYNKTETFELVAHIAKDINALQVMRNYGFALDVILHREGKANFYHLITLDSIKKTVTIKSYPKIELSKATEAYAQAEGRAREGEKIESVLVSAGDVRLLKKAYPNFFLDVEEFVTRVEKIIQDSNLS